MEQPPTGGPSGKPLSRTEYLLLVIAGVVALYLLFAGDFLGKIAGSVLFWRVLTWLRTPGEGR
jgi:hypothetical protein